MVRQIVSTWHQRWAIFQAFTGRTEGQLPRSSYCLMEQMYLQMVQSLTMAIQRSGWWLISCWEYLINNLQGLFVCVIYASGRCGNEFKEEGPLSVLWKRAKNNLSAVRGVCLRRFVPFPSWRRCCVRYQAYCFIALMDLWVIWQCCWKKQKRSSFF